MTQNANNLCWLDMEMTGLDPERERIIEVAMIITDSDLNVLAQSEVYVVHQSDELLDGIHLAMGSALVLGVVMVFFAMRLKRHEPDKQV